VVKNGCHENLNVEMKTKLAVICLLFLLPASLVRAEVLNCAVCGKPITGKFSKVEDKAVGGIKNVCSDCVALETHCFACGLPVAANYTTLPDGRILCERDNQEAVHAEDEARQTCDQVRDELNRTFSRFMTFPADNVVVSIVDKHHLENLFKTAGYEHCVSFFGATQSRPLPGNRYVHSISLLSDLRKSRLMAVCAHEIAHTWLNQNLKQERKMVIAPETAEGFCEMLAYKLMESHEEKHEMENLKASDYTRGQIAVLLDTEEHYGFNAVLEWMKSGEDARLDANNLERVRAVQPGATKPTPVAALLAVPVAAPATAPESLVLKGISGSAQRRFALINDSTFEALEKGKVRVGKTNVTVRCLEIRGASVVVQVEGSDEKKELFLRAQ
jgi:hypothetical protein